ncbi:MAG: hypothetical protein KF812_08895 [Fimbriimonadaceae bacterium]|nr:hypothetical protein [Fimbriimonadaceae bacterium]
MKLRTSTLVGGLVALGAAGYGGWYLYGESQLRSTELNPIAPGDVNLIAMNPGAGYRIIVSNQVAQLAELSGGSDTSEDRDETGEGDQDIVGRRRLPIRELLGAMQGNAEPMGKLIMALNDIDENDLPPNRVIWDSADVEKALSGDPALKAKLERDLHTRVDGTPLETLNMSSLLDGIVLRIPVKMVIDLNGTPTTVETTILDPFMTQFASQAGKRLTAKFIPSDAARMALYNEEAAKVNGTYTDPDGNTPPSRKEDLATSLRSRYSDQRVEELKAKPDRVLRNAFVVVSDPYVMGASSSEKPGPRRDVLTDIRLSLSNEGRLRLWKYSRQKPGFQLLFIVNGVAIAAPKIKTELAQSEVTIRNIGDPDLAKDAVETINNLHSQ